MDQKHEWCQNQELLIRIDENVRNLKDDVAELKTETTKRFDAHAKKLSAHNVSFGEINVRLAEQDSKITTGKFWKTLIGIVLGLAAITGGLATWIK